ncbi:phosphoribosyltransferase [Wenxinia marina]|nr:phosphoribosyltransferase [Wenxinia marina]
MNDTIVRNLHRLPKDIDLVVGVPRSGILAANLFCLVTNIPMTDLDSFLEGKIYTSGVSPKRREALDRGISDMRRILVLDDSINGGRAMLAARKRIEDAHLSDNVMMAAVYGAQPDHKEADFVFEVVARPRVFQWNLMHHEVLERSCVDIDGVLCFDPTEEENDDGARYEDFISRALPLHVPTKRLGTLVTSRLEKYRTSTEAWLKKHRIEYGELVMLDLPSKAERQRLKSHGSFKGSVYRNSDAQLFIESEPAQAEAIARISGKPVFCVESQQMYYAEPLTPAALRQKLRTMPSRLRESRRTSKQRMKEIARGLLGEESYARLKNVVKRPAIGD